MAHASPRCTLITEDPSTSLLCGREFEPTRWSFDRRFDDFTLTPPSPIYTEAPAYLRELPVEQIPGVHRHYL